MGIHVYTNKDITVEKIRETLIVLFEEELELASFEVSQLDEDEENTLNLVTTFGMDEIDVMSSIGEIEFEYDIELDVDEFIEKQRTGEISMKFFIDKIHAKLQEG